MWWCDELIKTKKRKQWRKTIMKEKYLVATNGLGSLPHKKKRSHAIKVTWLRERIRKLKVGAKLICDKYMMT
jgi:hypothetical protein